mmetsp:Transcript_150606/g.419813  ORF Transcript_150606/g.419813 Transcript_150606/m.419813 type:complete len:239 (-) Transcript_150606:542-1258(-)
MTPIGRASTQRLQTMVMAATSFPGGVVGVWSSPYPRVVAVTMTHQKHVGMESKGLLSWANTSTHRRWALVSGSQVPCSAKYMSAPKMTMPSKRFRVSTYRARSDRHMLRMMMTTAWKRLPSRKALMTRVRRMILRIRWSSPPMLAKASVRYHGKMAARSMRFAQWNTHRSTRPSLLGTMTTSSLTSQDRRRLLSESASSLRMKAERRRRSTYSTVKRTTHTRSMTLKASTGSGLQVSS